MQGGWWVNFSGFFDHEICRWPLTRPSLKWGRFVDASPLISGLSPLATEAGRIKPERRQAGNDNDSALLLTVTARLTRMLETNCSHLRVSENTYLLVGSPEDLLGKVFPTTYH